MNKSVPQQELTPETLYGMDVFPRLPLPRPDVVRRFDYAMIPAGLIISVFFVLAVSWNTNAFNVSLGWAAVMLVFIVLAAVAYLRESGGPLSMLNLNGWLGHSENGVLGIVSLALAIFIFWWIAHSLDLTALPLLIPLFFFPPILHALQRPRDKRLSWEVSFMVLFIVLATLAIAWWEGYRKNCPITSIECVWPLSAADTRTLVAILAVTVWLTYLLILAYYALRRYQLSWGQAFATHRFISSLLQMEDPLQTPQEVLDLWWTEFGFGDRAFLVQVEDETLRVVAHVGADSKVAHNYRIEEGTGVSWDSVNAKRPIYASDVSRYPGYVSAGIRVTGSEVAVPIMVEAQDISRKSVWGTLNVQSYRKRAFSKEHRHWLTMIASYLGLVEQRYLEAFEREMNLRLAAFYDVSDPYITADEIARIARELFGAKFVCYLRLGTGVGLPIQCAIAGDCSSRDSVSTLVKESDGILRDWLIAWRPRFQPYLKRFAEDRLLGDRFSNREGISSMAFLPVGPKKARVGAILLCFSEETSFSRTTKSKLRSFGREVAGHAQKAEFMAAVHQGFAHPQLKVHSLISETAQREMWSDILDRAIAEDRESGTRLELSQLKQDLIELFDQLRSWAAIYEDYYDAYGRFRLHDALKTTRKRLKKGSFKSLKIHIRTDPALEKESDDLKMILHTMIAEAMKNTAIHGISATYIRIDVRRRTEEIRIDIRDDGVGFDPESEREKALASDSERPFGGGIFAMEHLACNFLGAEVIDWKSTSPGNGTWLQWRIPILEPDD